MRFPTLFTILGVAAGAASPAVAQQSTSYSLVEHVINSGGVPFQATVLASTSFRVTFAAIGDVLAAGDLTSASFRATSSLVQSNAPPGEVANLSFTNATTLSWEPERSVGHYNLYRALASSLPGLAFGACHDPLVPLPTAIETDFPPPGAVYFYLATAENRLGEEGTKGFSSAGIERHGSDCP